METSQQAPSHVLASGKTRRTATLYRIAATAGSLGIVTLAIAYILGYVVWNSYLGKYGLHLDDFLRLEYLSGAVCYLLFSFIWGLPVLYLALYIHFGKSANLGPLHKTMMIPWLYLVLESMLFFSLSGSKPATLTYYEPRALILEIGLIHLVIFGLFKKRLQNSSVGRVVSWGGWWPLYGLLFVVALLIAAPNANLDFILSYGATAGTISYFANINREAWQNHKFVVNISITVCAFLILLNNAKEFGDKQFALIPKQDGGGFPERARLLATPSARSSFESLNLHPDSVGWVGPIRILARTEKDTYILGDNANLPVGPAHALSIKNTLYDAIEYSP